MAYVSSGMYESSILMRYKTPSSGDYDNDALYTTNITLDSDYAMAFIKTYDVTKQIDNYKLYVFKKGILLITSRVITAIPSLESYNSDIEFDVFTAFLFKSVKICWL